MQHICQAWHEQALLEEPDVLLVHSIDHSIHGFCFLALVSDTCSVDPLQH
jgi:hypothetical protein